MRSVHFYELSRAAQERFVASTRGHLAPPPLAVRAVRAGPEVGWFVAAGAFALCVLGLLALGFGDLQSPLGIAPNWVATASTLGGALSIGSLLRGLVLLDRARDLPFRPGLYLFPSALIDARSDGLQVYSVEGMQGAQASATGLVVDFGDGHSFTFPASGEETQGILKALRDAKEQLNQARRAESVRRIAALDPLYVSNFPAPLSSSRPHRPAGKQRTWTLLAAAFAAGGVLGAAAFKGRNILSEERLYALARATDSVSGYQQYLERGGRRADVTQRHLPLALVGEADRREALDELLRYARARATDPAVATLATQAARRVLLDRLQSAQQGGTLAELASFTDQHPDHALIGDELRAARRAIYEAHAERLEGLARPRQGQRDSAAFFRALLMYASEHGPQVHLRMRHQRGASFESADDRVRRERGGRYFRGTASLPSVVFDEAMLNRVERAAADRLASALQRLVPSELVHFEVETPPPGGSPSAELSVPTLLVDWRVEVGGGRVDAERRQIWLATGSFFDAHFRFPQQTPTLPVSLSTWKTASEALTEEPKPSHRAVYEDAARQTTEVFIQRFLEALLSDAGVPAAG